MCSNQALAISLVNYFATNKSLSVLVTQTWVIDIRPISRNYVTLVLILVMHKAITNLISQSLVFQINGAMKFVVNFKKLSNEHIFIKQHMQMWAHIAHIVTYITYLFYRSWKVLKLVRDFHLFWNPTPTFMITISVQSSNMVVTYHTKISIAFHGTKQ